MFIEPVPLTSPTNSLAPPASVSSDARFVTVPVNFVRPPLFTVNACAPPSVLSKVTCAPPMATLAPSVAA